MIISERDAHILQEMTQHCDEIYETLQYFGATKEEFLENSICHGAACMEFQLVGEGIKLLSRNILGNVRKYHGIAYRRWEISLELNIIMPILKKYGIGFMRIFPCSENTVQTY